MTALLPSSAPQLLPASVPQPLAPALTNHDHDVLGLQRRLRGVLLPLQQRLPGRGQSLLLPLTGRLLLQHGLSCQCAGKAGFAPPRSAGLGVTGEEAPAGTLWGTSRVPRSAGREAARPERPDLGRPGLVIVRTGSPFPRQAPSELRPPLLSAGSLPLAGADVSQAKTRSLEPAPVGRRPKAATRAPGPLAAWNRGWGRRAKQAGV